MDIRRFFEDKPNGGIRKTLDLGNIRNFTIPHATDDDISTEIENLSDSQRKAYDAVCEGHNVFITGPAGTGKSHLIQTIVNYATRNFKNVQCCAMTGCAAFLLKSKAKTLHSWSGIGINNKSDNDIVQHIKNTIYKAQRWRKVDMLIIDEVSMMSDSLFELIDKIGKSIRRNNHPFGGIQVILSGDFYQLAPMNDKKYCFQSPLWYENMTFQIELKKIFRQREKRFTKILNQIRRGKISRKSYDLLCKYINRDRSDLKNGIKPTILFPRKFQVERLNKTNMRKLKTPSRIFDYKITYSQTTKTKTVKTEENNMIKNGPFESSLELKEGAQVMCIANLDVEKGICNGSTGIITRFDSFSGCPVVQFNSGIVRTIKPHAWYSESNKGVTIHQIPLVAAWAITIHKSQGATLDLVEIDCGNSIFADGQMYVALSRVKSLDGLYLKSFSPHKITQNEEVDEFYKNMK